MDFKRSARRLRAAAVLPLLALGLAACGDDDDDNGDPVNPGPGSLVDVAREQPDLTTLVSALEAAGLDPALEETGPFTVFAPYNQAFNNLPAGWVANLLNPANEDLLERILTYHVVPGQFLSSDLTNGQTLTTLEGAQLTVRIEGGVVSIEDESGTVVGVVRADLEASNGVLHIIDGVFTPQLDIVEMMRISGYGALVALVEEAGLTETLQGEGPFTVFAPTNTAFDGVADPGDALADVLTYHVVAGEDLRAADLSTRDGDELTTVQGETITIDVDEENNLIFVVDANGNRYGVIEADIVGSNGVVHGINGVLLPAVNIVELAQILGLTGVVDAAVAAELDEALTGGTWTVFAPPNAAFEALPTDGEGNPIVVNPLLADILSYHAVAEAEVLSGDLSDGQVVTMANGDELTVNVDGDTGAVSLTDELGNTIAVTATDLRASNGVIHLIDGILTPSLNIVEVAQLNGFTTLIDLAVTAELDDDLSDEGATLTVFAPTNEAFAALPAVPERPFLDEVLLYHVLGSIVRSGDLTDNQLVTTLNGDIFTVNIDGEGNVTITDGSENTVNVIAVDVPANNGVIHVIDGVLLPAP